MKRVPFETRLKASGMFDYDLFANLPKHRSSWFKRLVRRFTWIIRGVV
jgi:hypothetical protein